jgi:hypothetical protein
VEIETMEIEKVSGTNRKKPGGKKQTKRSRKPAPNREPDQLPSPPPEQLLSERSAPLETPPPDQPHSESPEPVQSTRPEPVQTQNPDQMLSQQPEPLQDSPKQVEAAMAPATTPPIDFQTIATAYGDYTKKSFAETKAYVEKLAGVRSLDKIVEIQTEFARQAYETFVTESKRIRELYSGLAKQNLKPFEGFVTRKKPPAH